MMCRPVSAWLLSGACLEDVVRQIEFRESFEELPILECGKACREEDTRSGSTPRWVVRSTLNRRACRLNITLKQKITNSDFRDGPCKINLRRQLLHISPDNASIWTHGFR